jgi:hypothetical protein
MAYDFNIDSFSETAFKKNPLIRFTTTDNCANSHLMYLIDHSFTLIELSCILNLRHFAFRGYLNIEVS